MHKNWCGRDCSHCSAYCKLDERIACSPDCKLLGEDGVPIDVEKCKACGCEAYYEIDMPKSPFGENLLYDIMSKHAGHNVSITNYGEGINMTLECNDCNCVLFDTDAYDLIGVD